MRRWIGLALLALGASLGCGRTPGTGPRPAGAPDRFVGLGKDAIEKLTNADLAAHKLAIPSTLSSLLAAIPKTAWDHKSDPAELSQDDGAQIYQRISASFSSETSFAGYSAWPWSKTIAVDEGGEAILINRRKIAVFSVDDYVGTIWHEHAHKAGYLHDGNHRKGNECTVPHLVGDAATAAATKDATRAWGPLPPDLCVVLRDALGAQSH